MPDIDHFEIGNEIALPELYALCKESLCDVSRIFDINAAPPSQSAPEPLGEALQGNPAGQLLSPNLLQLLRSASFKVNCFAIYTRQSGEPWRMRYLGEAAVQPGRAVLSACLLPDPTRSHPVYVKFNEALQAGCNAGLRMIHVEPDTLHHFIHEKLIAEMRSEGVLDWHPAMRVGKW
jgi:hypothetical protein